MQRQSNSATGRATETVMPENTTLYVHTFVFGPFEENTYLLSDSNNNCAIVDPGCYHLEEQQQLADYITTNHLKPVILLNTHGHIDHVCGNAFVHRQYGLRPWIHKDDLDTMHALPLVAERYGLHAESSPEPIGFLEGGNPVSFGNGRLDVLFTPGHSRGSVSFFIPDQKMILSGDVLFYGSIGRTDLPGGDHPTLIRSIREQLLPLGDDITVLSGHGRATNIGFERLHNPYLQ